MEGAEAPNPRAYQRNCESFNMTAVHVWVKKGDQKVGLERQAKSTFCRDLQWVVKKLDIIFETVGANG